MINIGELITDPDFAQPGGINIIRRKCEIVNHRPVPTETVLNVPGIITIASDTSVEKLPEADRSTEDIHIFTHEQLLTTGRKGRSPHGEHGLKYVRITKNDTYPGRSPHGEHGLKSCQLCLQLEAYPSQC